MDTNDVRTQRSHRRRTGLPLVSKLAPACSDRIPKKPSRPYLDLHGNSPRTRCRSLLPPCGAFRRVSDSLGPSTALDSVFQCVLGPRWFSDSAA